MMTVVITELSSSKHAAELRIQLGGLSLWGQSAASLWEHRSSHSGP